MKLVQNENTTVFAMDNVNEGEKNTQFAVFNKYHNNSLGVITFQNGDIENFGINGITEVDLLTILKMRHDNNPEVVSDIEALIEKIK